MTIKRRTAKPENNYTHVKGDFENLQEGEYEARLCYVADLGLHVNEYKGERKADVQKLALCFEILDNPVQIGGELQPRTIWLNPFNIYWSLTEKGKELQYYKVFNSKAKDGDDADWEAQLGKPCSLTIEHTPSKKDDKVVYDTIAAVNPIPVKYQKDVSEGELETGVGDADEPESDVMKKLHGLAKVVFDQRIGNEGASKPSQGDNKPPVESYEQDPEVSGGFTDTEVPF